VFLVSETNLTLTSLSAVPVRESKAPGNSEMASAEAFPPTPLDIWKSLYCLGVAETKVATASARREILKSILRFDFFIFLCTKVNRESSP